MVLVYCLLYAIKHACSPSAAANCFFQLLNASIKSKFEMRLKETPHTQLTVCSKKSSNNLTKRRFIQFSNNKSFVRVGKFPKLFPCHIIDVTTVACFTTLHTVNAFSLCQQLRISFLSRHF